eukprot:3141391-Pleurochrysis_carterae.AAC.2
MLWNVRKYQNDDASSHEQAMGLSSCAPVRAHGGSMWDCISHHDGLSRLTGYRQGHDRIDRMRQRWCAQRYLNARRRCARDSPPGRPIAPLRVPPQEARARTEKFDLPICAVVCVLLLSPHQPVLCHCQPVLVCTG